jgi:hypothetical protein
MEIRAAWAWAARKKGTELMNPVHSMEHRTNCIRPTPILNFMSFSVQFHSFFVREDNLAGILAHPMFFHSYQFLSFRFLYYSK